MEASHKEVKRFGVGTGMLNHAGSDSFKDFLSIFKGAWICPITDLPYIGKVQIYLYMLPPVLLYRAAYHNFAHKLIENGGVKLRNIQVLVHQFQKLVHIGNLPGLCLNFPFQHNGKLLNLRLLLIVLTA